MSISVSLGMCLRCDMGNVCDKNCSDCHWVSLITGNHYWCCNYLIRTDKKRPCPPGEGCTVKVRVKRKRLREQDRKGGKVK